MRRHLIRALAATIVVLAVLALAAGLWGYTQVRGSLPQLEGTLQVTGLSARVEVTRDALGIPTIRGASRQDVARATGFVHAQDRFFQMDLARRRAAGELSALIGERALPVDLEVRLHRFRSIAHQAVSLLSPYDRDVLRAYTAGVNAGLAAARAVPVEYLLLRQTPRAWREEDSLLVVLSMFVTLQDTNGAYESTLATMHDVLPPEMFELLAPRGTEWDAPLIGEPFATAAIPGPDVYNLRARRAGTPPAGPATGGPDVQPPKTITSPGRGGERSEWQEPAGSEAALGSNNWAIAGHLTGDGGALVANDMHLSIRVPNTWYRAMLEWPDASDASQHHQLIGITMPGVPALVVGSNGHLAWGFTNTYADWSDLVLLEIDSENPNRYRTPGGWRAFDVHDEVITVAGQPDQHHTVTWTIWGPVLPPDHRGRLRAYRWVAHDADRLAATITPLENVRTLDEALAAVNGLGIPGQNFVAADRDGRIGWSVYGALPRRVGLDGGLPASWADGTRGWNGWLDPAEYPRIVDPPAGRLWTANARVVDGDMLARLGDGSYDIGSRARIIRDRLSSREQFTPGDLLALQLDTSADFLSRWRELLLDTLATSATGSQDRARLREIVQGGWSGHASPDSAAYRLTRMFRELVSNRVSAFLLAECYEADERFDYTTVRRREGPIWKIVTEQPMHLLDPRYERWDMLFLEAADAVIQQAMRDRSGDLAERVWSEYNVTTYRHPLSTAVPWAGRWLDMPFEPLPGDLFTPRVHWGSVAASVRMVVSPGREADGIMHMPTGQSGHPLSPFYRNSHGPWVSGEPTPFLPGPGIHTLILAP